jgi:hypothetical protein
MSVPIRRGLGSPSASSFRESRRHPASVIWLHSSAAARKPYMPFSASSAVCTPVDGHLDHCLSMAPPPLAALLLSCMLGAPYCCSLRERRRCVVVLLCGTSGSGKSTLASILVRLQPPDGDSWPRILRCCCSGLSVSSSCSQWPFTMSTVQMQCCLCCVFAPANPLCHILLQRHGCVVMKL